MAFDLGNLDVSRSVMCELVVVSLRVRSQKLHNCCRVQTDLNC